MTSNSANIIKELRREMTRYKGISKRAHASAADLRRKAQHADDVVRSCQREIEDMGGKVRR